MTAEIIQFIPKAVPDREALIKEARAVYEGIFPTDYTQIVDAEPVYIAPDADPA